VLAIPSGATSPARYNGTSTAAASTNFTRNTSVHSAYSRRARRSRRHSNRSPRAAPTSSPITDRLAVLLDAPDAALRAGMVAVQVLGLAVARYVVRIEAVAEAPVEDLVARFGPVVQQCLTGGPAPTAGAASMAPG
jgi:hypothetical protein